MRTVRCAYCRTVFAVDNHPRSSLAICVQCGRLFTDPGWRPTNADQVSIAVYTALANARSAINEGDLKKAVEALTVAIEHLIAFQSKRD